MPAKIGRTNAAARPQKPTSRARSLKSAPRSGAPRRWQKYLPSALLIGLCAAVLAAAGVLYYVATASAFFQAREISVTGNARTSADEIRAIALRQTANTGVWRADLPAISAEINRLPWVRQAVVSRVLPDGLRIVVKERGKTAVILTANGKALWVDGEGVRLGPYAPADKIANLILLKGWNEQETPEAAAENRQRMDAYKAMLSEWDGLGLSKRISDVNLADLRDVHLALRSAGDVPIALGDRNWGSRLKDAIQTLDNEKRADAQALDAKLDDHVIVSYRESIVSPVAAGDRARPAAAPTTSPKPNTTRR